MMRIFLTLFALISFNAHAFEAKVIAVHDGDTITVMNDKGANEKIRLYRADAPEIAYTIYGKHVDQQPYAAESRAALASLCMSKTATLTRYGKSYGRTVAYVSCGGVDVATYQIENGNAWAYRYTATKRLKQLQAVSKASGIGLWALPTPIEPRLWRQGVKP